MFQQQQQQQQQKQQQQLQQQPSEAEQLFMIGSNNSQSSTKDVRGRRENYAIEIRNQTRQTLFATRRQQLKQEICTTTTNQFGYLEYYHNFLNNVDQVEALKKIKASVNDDLQIYACIWLDADGYRFMKQLIQIIQSTSHNQLAYLAAYHLNNMIYYADQRLQQVMHLPELINILIMRVQSSVKVNDLQTATSLLYCLANIYGDEDVYKEESLKSVHIELGGLLHDLVLQGYNNYNMVVPINKDHLLFTNGLCWLLRNLCYQDATYASFGQTALKCCDVLWPDVQKYMLNGEIGQQIAEDTLLIVKYVADKCSDDELSSFFDVHISLMIGIVTYRWPKEQQQTVVEVLKNLTAGQDDVLEQLISLGVLDLINQIIQEKPLSQQPCLIGTLGNFFYADDEEIITRVLEALNQDQIISEMILSLQDPLFNINTLRAFANLVKNYPEIKDDLLNRSIILSTIQNLNQKITFDIEEDGLELLNALLEQDLSDSQCEMEQESPCRVQQMIVASGGEKMLEMCLTSKNEQTVQWATKILQALQVQY